MTHYFIEWTTPSGLLEKIYYPYKKFDTSNRSSTVPRKKTKAKQKNSKRAALWRK